MLHIWNELTQTAGHQAGYANLVGNVPKLVQSTIDSQSEGGPIIENPTLVAPGQGDIAGQKRVDSLLKELSKTSLLNRAYDVSGTDTTVGGDKQQSYGKTTNEVPQGNVDPVGSKQNKIYRKPKGN